MTTHSIDPGATLAAARRLQAAMTAALVLVAGLAAAAVIASLAAPEAAGFAVSRLLQGVPATDAPMAAWQGVVLLAVGLGHLALWVGSLATARVLFGCLANGDGDAAADRARVLSLWLWSLLAWGIGSQVIASAAATWHLPDGQRAVAIALGTPQISLAICALLAGFMARAFALGAALWRDHRAVV